MRKLNTELDSMACQMVLLSPKWSPESQRGKPVIVRFTFPFYINMDPPVENQNEINKKKTQFKKEKLPLINVNSIPPVMPLTDQTTTKTEKINESKTSRQLYDNLHSPLLCICLRT
jgi:hypothetical protein